MGAYAYAESRRNGVAEFTVLEPGWVGNPMV
jgi:hypothetical protein